VIKVRIKVGTIEKVDVDCWTSYEDVYTEGQLINIFWHPVNGPIGAVLTEYDTIETFELSTIEVVAEEKA